MIGKPRRIGRAWITPKTNAAQASHPGRIDCTECSLLAICRLRDSGRAFYFDRAPESTSFSAHLQILRPAVIVNTIAWSCLESRP